MRTPITDTGKEFVLDIYVPGGDDKETLGKNEPSKETAQDNKNTHGKEEGKEMKTGTKSKISYGCKAKQGGYWNSIMQEDEDEGLQCQTCRPATFRRHP